MILGVDVKAGYSKTYDSVIITKVVDWVNGKSVNIILTKEHIEGLLNLIPKKDKNDNNGKNFNRRK